MKNFTNNFKQFTSRLSARWLIMALMMLLGTSSAWAAYYVTGDAFGSWGTWYELKYETANRYTRSISNINEEFKLSSGQTYDNCWNSLGCGNGVKCGGGSNHKMLGVTGILCFDPSGNNGNGYIWVEEVIQEPSAYSLGGYINKSDVKSYSDTYKLTKQSDGTYKRTISFTQAHNDAQYLWIIDDLGNKWGVSSDTDLTTGNSITLTKGVESGKVKAIGVINKDYIFIFNPSNGLLSYLASCSTPDFSVSLSKSEVAVGCTGVTASIKGNDSPTVTWSSSKTSVATINSSTGAITIKAAGTTTITATTTEADGFCGGVEKKATLTVKSPSVTVKENDNSLCEGETLTLTATLTNCGADNSIQWYKGEDLLTGENKDQLTISSVTTTNSGEYKAVVTGGIICSSIESSAVTITVNARPSAPSLSNPEAICQGTTFTLPEKDDSKKTITWVGIDDRELTGLTVGDHTYSAKIVENGCESTTVDYTITVKEQLAKPDLAVTNVKQCGSNYTEGKIVINYYNPANTYILKKEGETIDKTYNNGYSLSENEIGTYTVEVSKDNACGATSDVKNIDITDNTPTITNAAITAGKDAVCVNTGTTLTASATTDKGTLSYLWNTDATTESIETGNLTENTTYTVTITATNAGCAVSIPTVLSKTITVNPVSAPTITASANSGVNAIDLTVSVADAGCAESYTLGYRIKQSDDLEYGENQVVKTNTTETQVSTTIDGLVTGVEYIIQAYIINGYNNNEVFYADPITCTVLASENCDAPSADYIEILANNDDALQLYAWTTVNGTTPLGGFPGKTRDTWYEVNSTGYSVWKIETSDPVYLIFNKGDNSKTGDIKGTDNEGFKPGYRYIFDVNLSTWNYTLQSQTLIADPEVETVSATPVRIDETKSNVTLVGRIIKRGCADIRSYGFQYKLIDAKDYSNLEVGTGDIEPGSTFTGSLELGVGTYYLRARVENENGSKAYGDEFRITIAERDLTIAAIHNDTIVDTDTYYDFVGLYMSSVTKPTTVDIVSYTWYKNDDVYNPTFTESTLYGDTYINSNGTNNVRPNETGVYKLEVELSNGTTLESNEITVTEASAVSASSILTASNRTLPVISVRTNEDFPTCKSGSYPSAQADKLKKKRSVDVKIFDKDGKLYYDRKARMNYRGSSSLNFVKKSYAFCPGGDMCGDVEKGLDYVITEKVNMFNLGASDKDWVLYAAAADPSLMRNRIVFDTYAAMTNKWGVKSMFVELVVDGNYKGVYVFMDKITKNKNRVDITAADGFIVKFDKTDTADRYVDGKQEKGDEKTFMTERTGRQGISTYGTTVDQMFEIEYPEKDDNKGTWNNIVASIKDKFETFETALAEGNYSKVREIIDYNSWADWFIISEYIKNQDAYRASCIFVYNGEKIEARPLWDQELSMNNTSHTSHNCDDTNSLLITTASIYGDDFPAPFWFTGHDGASIEGGLLKDGCFISLVQTKLADYLKEGAALYAGEDAKDKRGPILKLAHDFNEELVSKTEGQTSAQEREDKFWVGKSRSSAECGGTHSYSQSSYSNEYGNVKNWILGDHDENLTSILGGMSGEMTSGISITTSPDNAIVTPWIPITVTVNVADDAEYIYDDSSITQGIELDVDKAITSKSGNKYTYTFPRPADWNVDNVETAIEQIVYPINAQLKVKDTTCPGVSNETQIRIRLRDEGNDICGELIEQ